MNESQVIRSHAWSDQDIITLARIIVPETRQPATTADFEDEIELHVIDLNRQVDRRIHEDLHLQTSELVFDTPIYDAMWAEAGSPDTVGYNFRHAILSPPEFFDCRPGHTLRLAYCLRRKNGRAPLWVVHERTLDDLGLIA